MWHIKSIHIYVNIKSVSIAQCLLTIYLMDLYTLILMNAYSYYHYNNIVDLIKCLYWQEPFKGAVQATLIDGYTGVNLTNRTFK